MSIDIIEQEKDWSMDTYNNTDGLWENNDKWKEPIQNVHILYDFIHMKCPEQDRL